MRMSHVTGLVLGVALFILSRTANRGELPDWVTAIFFALLGGYYIGTAVVTIFFERVYLRWGGKTMFFDPMLTRQAHLAGKRVTVFPQDKEQRKMIVDLTQWTYLVQFEDGTETFAHRTELKNEPTEIGKYNDN